jgi:hypothetical protein
LKATRPQPALPAHLQMQAASRALKEAAARLSLHHRPATNCGQINGGFREIDA